MPLIHWRPNLKCVPHSICNFERKVSLWRACSIVQWRLQVCSSQKHTRWSTSGGYVWSVHSLALKFHVVQLSGYTLNSVTSTMLHIQMSKVAPGRLSATRTYFCTRKVQKVYDWYLNALSLVWDKCSTLEAIESLRLCPAPTTECTLGRCTSCPGESGLTLDSL